MRINQILTERLSSVLYHYTSARTLMDIINSNQFRLTPDLGTDAESGHRSRGKIYYGSFSRSRVSKFHYPMSEYQNGSVIMVVDGDRLQADGYTGRPIDYWQFGDNDEMEDRVFSRKSHIEDFVRYIREVHILITEKQGAESRDKAIRAARMVYRKLKPQGIPVYVYTNAKAMNMLKKSASVNILDLTPASPPEKPYSSTPGTNWFAPYIELLKVSDREKLGSRAQRALYNIQSPDAIHSIQADIHNNRTGRGRPDLDKFINHLRAHNLTSVQDYVAYVLNKFG